MSLGCELAGTAPGEGGRRPSVLLLVPEAEPCGSQRGGLFWVTPVTAQWLEEPEAPGLPFRDPLQLLGPRGPSEGGRTGLPDVTETQAPWSPGLLGPPSEGNRGRTLAPRLQSSSRLAPAPPVWELAGDVRDTSVLWACDASSCHREASRLEVRRTNAPPRWL